VSGIEWHGPFPIKRVRIENFRCFEGLTWEAIDPQMNVIVAPNGGGKTALLDAIAVGLAPFVRHRARTGGWNITDWDALRLRTAGGETLRAPGDVSVSLEGDSGSPPWVVTRGSSPNARTRTKNAEGLQQAATEAFARRSSDVPLPVIAYYGTSRLWGEQRLTNSRLGRGIEDGYLDCLDPRVSFRAFEEWVAAVSHDRLNDRSGVGARRQWSFLISVLQVTLRWERLTEFEYSANQDALLAGRSDGPMLPVQRLSDGIRTLLGLVGDLARRISLLNSGISGWDLMQTPGIVMVDEIDLHLHPSWQQRVVASIAELFPNIQWIVTTHSEQVVSTVGRRRVWEFDFDDGGTRLVNPQQQTEGVSSADVLASVFGVDPMPPTVWRERLNMLDSLIDVPDSDPRLTRTLQELREHFGANDPMLQSWQTRRLLRKRAR
jgi:predicted ATP-binding protein involved in virulence